MRKKPDRVWVILFIGLALLTIAGIARVNMGRDRIPWRDDYAMASNESALTHKPMFLYFTAVWCEPCQALKTSTWADAGVAHALAGYVPVKIDVDLHPDLFAKYGGEATPTFVTVDTAGKPVKATEGYLDPSTFLNWLKS